VAPQLQGNVEGAPTIRPRLQIRGARCAHTSRCARPPTDRTADGQALPFPADSFDSALSTWTLCTIPDPDAALRELLRVLRPGGAFHFLEHGLAPDEKVRRWQHRLDPVQRRVAGGCHVTRQAVDLVTAAGFTVVEVDRFYEPRSPKVMGAMTLGVAVAPQPAGA
jgi:SAM-dependent methyltransferase